MREVIKIDGMKVELIDDREVLDLEVITELAPRIEVTETKMDVLVGKVLSNRVDARRREYVRTMRAMSTDIRSIYNSI